MSSEGYDTTPGLPPQPRRTIDDLVESLERVAAAMSQAMISPDEQQEFERFELEASDVKSIDQTLSFIAREVRVDNFTNVHMEVTNAMFGQMWCPPRTVGYRIPLSGIRHVKIQQAAPPAVSDTTWTDETIAVFIFSKFPTTSVAVLDPNPIS